MKKFAVVFILLFALVFCSACDSTSNDSVVSGNETGLTVTGEGYAWKASSEYDITLQVKSDALVVSGTAECNILIWLMDGVSNLTLDNLNQGDYKIEIWFPQDSDCELYFSGDNTVYCIGMCDNIEIYGNNSEAELQISGAVDADEDLYINQGKIDAGFLQAKGTVEIIGETQLFLHSMKHENEMETSYARIASYESVYFDLEGEGIVDINGEGYSLIWADEEILLGQNTVIQNADGYNAGYSSVLECYAICNDAGEEAKSVIIKATE